MSLKENEQVTIRVSVDFMGFFRSLMAHEQLRHPGKRVTHRTIFEKALLRYSRQTYPDLILPDTLRR